jgi:hypothetical protein
MSVTGLAETPSGQTAGSGLITLLEFQLHLLYWWVPCEIRIFAQNPGANEDLTAGI